MNIINQEMAKHSPISSVSAALALVLGPASFYTIKINSLDSRHLLKSPENSILSMQDLPQIAAIVVISFLLLRFFIYPVCNWLKIPQKRLNLILPNIRGLTVFFFLCWFPFLLAFYPGTGMNDTAAMIKFGTSLVNQFPWTYVYFIHEGAKVSISLLGTAEPWLFICSLLQMGLMAFGLSFVIHRIDKLSGNSYLSLLLSAFFAFAPIINNYAIAILRDPLYSLALLLMGIFLADHAGHKIWAKSEIKTFFWLCIGLMFFRNNGLYILFIITALLMRGRNNESRRKIIFAFLAAAVIMCVPPKVISTIRHIPPLTQEKLAIPIQQIGRTAALNGKITDSQQQFLEQIYPLSDWGKSYNPGVVDSIKWNRDFNRTELALREKDFIAAWFHIGINNPDLYTEAWMLNTYWNWNVNFIMPDFSSQSRFGYAMTDENRKQVSEGNNQVAGGNLPISENIKNALISWSYGYSNFLGAGFCLWMTLVLSGALIIKGKARYLWVAVPTLLNTGTLLLATPFCGAFRYSFAYVLLLPFLLFLPFIQSEEQNKPNKNEGTK